METPKNKISRRNQILAGLMVLGLLALVAPFFVGLNEWDFYPLIGMMIYFPVIWIVVLVNLKYLKENPWLVLLVVLFNLIAFIIIVIDVLVIIAWLSPSQPWGSGFGA